MSGKNQSVSNGGNCAMSSSNLRLEQLFITCDTKNRGVIGPQEFRDLCNKFGIEKSDSNVIFMDLDHDGDGQIDFEDFSYGFRDFLTPGSRRGSLQIVSTDRCNTHERLLEMEKKHATAIPAWKQFMNNVGPTNIKPFVKNCGEQLYNIVEEIRSEKGMEVSNKLETALTALITDVQSLHDEYKSLETSFRKEREAHAAQLTALGEELDHQLAKTEAKAKAEARQEAQKQMDSERKKIAVEMESQLSDLSAQIRTFQKVEEWLSEEESRDKKLKNTEDFSKLYEAESENRNLRTALVEAQMKATLLQGQLAQKRNEYIDLYQELHSEKIAATEYKNQCDLMQNHLSLLSETNRVLSDANDCFSTAVPLQFVGQNDQEICINQNSSCDSQENHYSFSDQKFQTFAMSETDKDSGRGTLLEEIKAEGDGSPLPSGIWSNTSPSPSPQSSPQDTPITPAKNIINTSKSSSSLNKNESVHEFPVVSEPGSLRTSKENAFPHRTFKVILAGDAAVGKTTFIERICHGHFSANLSSTIGVDFRVKTVDVDGNCVALQLWDTAGQERFRSLTKSYFRRADGVILMYDVTNERTFVSIRQWIQNVEEGAGRKVPIVLCGNKIDLRENIYRGSSCVSHDDGSKLGRQCGAVFAETSPKTGHNVLEALMILAREMSSMEDAELKNSLKLNEETEKESQVKKKSCCSGSNKSSNDNSATYTSYS